jgi:hypothetical protein
MLARPNRHTPWPSAGSVMLTDRSRSYQQVFRCGELVVTERRLRAVARPATRILSGAIRPLIDGELRRLYQLSA